MRHFLWYKTSGEMGGEMTWPGGWPLDVDLSDPNTTDPTAIANRQWAAQQEDYAGILLYDCPCPPGTGGCNHNAGACGMYVAQGDPPALVEKEALACFIDGVDVGTCYNDGNNPHQVSAGVPFALRFEGAFADGYQFTLKNCQGCNLLAADTVMEFTGGVTQTLNLTASGVTGVFALNTLTLRPVRVVVRGD